MIQISAATRIGIIALLLGMAALFSAALDTPQATEAATWGSGSCIDLDDCSNLAAGTIIGEDSCNSSGFKNACDNLNGTVGDDSCIGDRACNNVGDFVVSSIGDNSCNSGGANNACDTLNGMVGDNSCNGDTACDAAGDEGSSSIGDNSCNDTRACPKAGANGGSSSIGDNSCNDTEACAAVGEDGSSSIGNGSCNGGEACLDAGNSGSSSIGDGSCLGRGACGDVGNRGGMALIGDGSCIDLVSTGSACLDAGDRGGYFDVGDGSCIGNSVCEDGGGDSGSAKIGDGSCLGEDACNSPGHFGSSEIGDGSCSGADVCKEVGDTGSSIIGRYSCNTTSTDCFQNQSTIGDCVFNDVDPPPCVSIDFGVTKTASDTSLPPGGANVTFEVEVENLDPFAIELTSLIDDVFGNLDGVGSCNTPQTIDPGDTYTCSFAAFVDADHENTVEADATDEQGNSGTRENDANVAVAIAEPTPPDPARPSLGGALGAVVVGGAQQARENRAAAAAAAQQQISPPSTGDAGLAAD